MKLKIFNNLAPYKKFIFKNFLKRRLRKKYFLEAQKSIVFYKKSPVLTNFFPGKTIKIHNGKKKVLKKITPRMGGLRVGELLLTRAFFEHKKKKKKKCTPKDTWILA